VGRRVRAHARGNGLLADAQMAGAGDYSGADHVADLLLHPAYAQHHAQLFQQKGRGRPGYGEGRGVLAGIGEIAQICCAFGRIHAG
jgi:hypothetical protein